MRQRRRFPIGLSLAVAIVLSACARQSTSVASTSQAPPPNTGELPFGTPAQAESLLVDVRAAEPTLVVEMRYATPNNFTGAVLPGYESNRAFLRREAAAALGRAQRQFASEGLSLKVFDAYRPVRATLAMVEWTDRVGRQDLIRDEYIASRSRHNLGLAIDLTLIDRATGRELDMGTPFDEFSERAHTANATGDVKTNRQRLKRVMEAEGFANYAKEWWHYSFDVPTPLRFDVVVR
jgi:zinc D-Ala-D-Ala dipeptidase